MKQLIPWTYSNIIWLTLSLFAISIILSYLWIFFGWTEVTTTRIGVSYAIQILLEVAVIWWFILRGKTISLKSFRWKWYSLGEMFGWLMQGYISIIGISAGLIFLQYYFNFHIPGFGQQESHIALFGNSLMGTVLLAIVAVIIAPLSEEFLFRGCLLQRMSHKPWLGIIISSAIFATVHFQFASFFPLFIVGVVIGYYYLKSNSLQVAIGIHILNNLVALIMEIYVVQSGGIEHILGTVGIVGFR